ncbi:MAG: tetratricopeptide repeat protein [Gemmatimonadaceae bacterium]
MSDSAAQQHRTVYGTLDQKLSAPNATAHLDALKVEIGMLYRAIDRDIDALTTLRDETRQLIERWKGLRGEQPSLAPAFAAERPTVHEDHIGASTFIEKGWSKLSLGDHEGAEVALRKAIDLSPNDTQAQALLGWALMHQEKYDEALRTFQAVLSKQPDNSLARINIGYISFKKKSFGDAIEHLSRAIRLDNDRKATLYAHFYLGLVYLERDMFEDAQTFFEKTIVLGPNLIEAYYELGRAFWFNGQQDEALGAWKRGVSTNKFNPWGKKCGEVLKVVAEGGEP